MTLGAGGALLHRGVEAVTRSALPVRTVADVTGAGDAFLAGFAAATAGGQADPLEWGLAAAALAVETDASVPALSPDAIRERLRAAP